MNRGPVGHLRRCSFNLFVWLLMTLMETQHFSGRWPKYSAKQVHSTPTHAEEEKDDVEEERKSHLLPVSPSHRFYTAAIFWPYRRSAMGPDKTKSCGFSFPG
ncbi:hypothetical protein Q8A73_000693 [Channa argus]|nr:hypothetical protein Q8A73_000693 [Channa argus]